MKPLLKIAILLIALFASTFVIMKSTGLITVEKIETWLVSAQSISPIYIAGTIIAVLFADLFIAIPTLTVTILAGYFLGAQLGALSAFTGMFLAAFSGYGLSYIYGSSMLNRVVKDSAQQNEMKETFSRYGTASIILARALPILPETTACLAGITKMKPSRFCVAWFLGTVPYVLLAAYAGSISSASNPKPAILTAIGITGGLWIFWYLYRRKLSQMRAKECR